MPNNLTTFLTEMQDKKNRGMALAASYTRLGNGRMAALILSCGTFLEVTTTEGGENLVTAANFCKARLCPACNRRRSLRIFCNTSRILDYIDEHGPKVQWLFLTLTVRNCRLDELGQSIDRMMEAFKRMTNNRAWKRRVLGSMRTLEVTVDWRADTAHPHLHLILAVPKEYGRRTNDLYWTFEDWRDLWQTSARLEYLPNVRIEKVRGRRSGVAEVSKYMAKDTDYIIDATANEIETEEAEAATDRVVSVLTQAMHKRRLVSYTGILKQAAQALRIEDAEGGELVDTLRGDVAAAVRRFHWAAGLGCYVEGRACDET